ncbi:hypothetical protein ISS07_01350 [Candidatus Woesearchaeota archaeon]|nr:hypothetical protein [Candidatus Woesearchaeota archaeon]
MKKRFLKKKVFVIVGMWVLVLFIYLLSSLFVFGDEQYKNNYKKQEEYYTELTSTRGTDVAFKDLKLKYKINQFVKSTCHDIVHFIGRASMKKYGDLDEAFSKGDSFCWSGYYHGIMEILLSEKENFNASRDINNICTDIEGKHSYSFNYFNCVHGLGHGLMFLNDNELFDSLGGCDFLSGWWERESCYGGVFIENVNTNLRYHQTKYLREDNLIYPCDVVDSRYKQGCYIMQTSYVLNKNNYDFEEGFEICEKVEKPFDDVCYQSLGRDASGSTISDIKKTKGICMIGKDFEQQSNCVVGAVKDFVAYYDSDKEARSFCGSLNSELKELCLVTLENFYVSF